MKTRLLLPVAGMVMLLVMICGCRHRAAQYAPYPGPASKAVKPTLQTITNTVNPEWLRPPTNLFTLGPGDRLEIQMMEETNTAITTVVGPDGKVYFNLLPGVDVWGLTLGQAKQVMEQQFTNYVRDVPRLNITLREVGSKRVWLLGRFQEPGVYSLAAPMTLLEAIAMSGGPLTFVGSKDISSGGPLGEDLADLKHSFVVRNGKLLPVDIHRLLNEGDLSQNIYLQADDFVYFAPAYAKEVYVLGAVLQPKPVQHSEGLTLAAAIAGAYGTIRDAHLTHVTIVRGSLAQPQATVVNYRDIVKGRAPDIALEPHDIVYVPFSPYRYLRKYAEIALNTFVSSVAINAGTRVAVGTQQGPSGIVIPIGSGIQIIPPSAPPIGQ